MRILIIIALFISPILSSAQNLFPIQENNKWGYINDKGEIKIPIQFYSVNLFVNGIAPVCFELGRCMFIHHNLDMAIKEVYSDCYSFSEGLAAIKEKSGKWGFIDSTGNLVIPAKYDEVKSFSNGFAAVKSNKKWGYINKKGETILELEYDNLSSINNYLGALKFQPGGYWHIFNLNPNPNQKEKIKLFDSFYYALSPIDGLFPVSKDGRFWGIINQKMEWVIRDTYYKIEEGSEGYFAAERELGKWSYINNKGLVEIVGPFTLAGKFVGGLAYVETENHKGYINKKGEWIWKKNK